MIHTEHTTHPARTPTRRTLLRGATAAMALLVVGCESDDDGTDIAATPVSEAAQATLLEQIAPDRTADLSVINASFETLTGEDRLFAFGLVGPDNTPVRDQEVTVYAGVRMNEALQGPLTTTFHDVPNQPLGMYSVRLDLPEAGTVPLIAVTADGGAGQTALRVADPESSVVLATGEEAPAVATPTLDDPLGFESICTRQPPCDMHAASLDTALAEGRPVMLTIATPAFCETAICGPTVDVVEDVRTGGEVPEGIEWIHLEVFSDAGTTLADQVEAFQLQSEPWIFGIDGAGTVVGRLDGPLTVLPDEIAALATATA
ncbi:hypothetical protein [Euzebya sp.]|uniref:hypothetical protein n=1 Tax=Euzebya sp. TaxID=1971409 RepID=UPI00351665EE